jgi:hypothetical protein
MSIELLLGVINVDDTLRLLHAAGGPLRDAGCGFMARDPGEALKFVARGPTTIPRAWYLRVLYVFV